MNLRDLPAGLRERWQNFSQTQKAAAALVTVAIAVCLFYLGSFIVRPQYAPLFTDLDVQQAGAIAENLKELKVKYRITDQGRTIEVPEDRVYELRMQLASEGVLPGAGQGFELFDQSKLAQTDFDEQVAYQRALQGELQRTITSIEAVEQARVHLVLPRKSVFIEEEGVASASVVLKLKPMAKLEQTQIKGINDLLIGSVEGLTSENIHIIDSSGTPLNDFIISASDTEGLPSGLLQQQQQLRREFEKDIEKRLKQLLAQVFGPGKATVMVSAELDFSKVQTKLTEVSEGAPVSEQKTTASGSNTGAGAPVGTTSQMPGSEYPFVGGGTGEYENESTTTNYENSREETIVDQPPGAVKRISTSVIVDSNINVDTEAVRQVVSAAVGYQPDRGDEIIVQTMPFDTGVLEAFGAEDRSAAENNLYTYIGIGAGILILLLLVIFLIRRRRKAKLQDQSDLVVPDVPDDAEQAVIQPPAPIEPDRKDILKEDAKRNPEEVAEIIKLWLKE